MIPMQLETTMIVMQTNGRWKLRGHCNPADWAQAKELPKMMGAAMRHNETEVWQMPLVRPRWCVQIALLSRMERQVYITEKQNRETIYANIMLPHCNASAEVFRSASYGASPVATPAVE
jgi:hypothetical protein